MKKFNKSLMAGLVVSGLVASFGANATNGYFSHGYGTKNKGLAGGGVALPQDAMAAATNPAGMAFVGARMDLGIAVFSPSPRSYSTTGGSGLADGAFCAPAGACPFTIGGSAGTQSIESDNDFFLIPHFAYNWQLNSDSTAGVTVYGNGGMNTEYVGGTAQFNNGAGSTTSAAGTYGNGTAGVNLEQLFINASYARKYSATGSVGASAILAYQRFEAKGLGNFAGFSLSGSNLTNKGVDSSTGFGLKLGIQDDIAPGVTVGLSYQTEMDMDKFDKYKGLFAEDGGFDIPATVTLGINWKTSESTNLTFDVQQIYYSDVKAIANPISRLTDGSCVAGAPATGAGCLGGSNGAGFGWDDMTIYKLGYQWKQDEKMTYRAGISVGDQPIPNSEAVFNILAPAVIETHLTFGFTMKTGKDSEFNFAGMYAPETSITGPNAFNPGQNITLEMTQLELEASWGWKF